MAETLRFFVRTTNERAFEYNLNYEKLIDIERKPVKSFIEQLKYISSWDSVLLEDDLVLCTDFLTEINKAISTYPDKIINFFTRPTEYFQTHEDNRFLYNQCTYYPKGVAKIVAEEMESIWIKNPNLQYDIIEDKALKNLKITHIQYRPCLIQHLDNNSLIGNKTDFRRTLFFLDDLNKLNISYSQAGSVINRFRLKINLNKYFGYKDLRGEKNGR